jgi:hypothetical protein
VASYGKLMSKYRDPHYERSGLLAAAVSILWDVGLFVSDLGEYGIRTIIKSPNSALNLRQE